MRVSDLKAHLTPLPGYFHVRVTPKASHDQVSLVQLDGATQIRVYVTMAAEDGKANKAVIKLLAKHLGLAKSSLVISHGLTSRDKRIEISR